MGLNRTLGSLTFLKMPLLAAEGAGLGNLWKFQPRPFYDCRKQSSQRPENSCKDPSLTFANMPPCVLDGGVAVNVGEQPQAKPVLVV